MAVVTKSLVRVVVNAPGGSDPAYTCPAGETTIIKHLTVYSTVGATSFEVGVRPGGGANPFYGIVTANLSSNVAQQFGLWVVLQPDDTIVCTAAGASGAVRFWISGSQLEGVAD